jgi:CRISPR/Cas system-associated exonuclease Cas4 (RecB family)
VTTALSDPWIRVGAEEDESPPGRPMADLHNDFTWSKSRHEKFKECLRAYYYQYYGSWGGWEAEAGSPVRELYVLKKLSSRWQWAGSVVHGALKTMLERARHTGEFRPLEALIDRTRAKARAEWANSRDKSYWREASRISGLVEHEYAEPVPNEEWRRLWEEVVEGSLRSFYASPTFELLRHISPERWLAVDELDAWDFEGTKIWVALDFAYRGDEGQVHVLDWKTGRERDVDRTQLAIYTLYAEQKWGVEADRVVGGLVYLGAGAERLSASADADTLETCQQEMRRSIAAMRGLLDDAQANRASEERFPKLLPEASCRRCPFRRPCGRL